MRKRQRGRCRHRIEYGLQIGAHIGFGIFRQRMLLGRIGVEIEEIAVVFQFEAFISDDTLVAVMIKDPFSRCGGLAEQKRREGPAVDLER